MQDKRKDQTENAYRIVKSIVIVATVIAGIAMAIMSMIIRSFVGGSRR